jgi:hypothetical protein
MTRARYGLLALIRLILLVLLLPFVRVWAYARPDQVGYRGGVDLRGRTLAFVRADGSLQFYW